MKRILSVFLGILMILSVLSFTACGETADTTANDTTANTNANTNADTNADTDAPNGEEPKPATVKVGFGIHTTATTANAADEKKGNGKATVTAAIVTVDADGKIVAATFDTAEITVEHTADGKAVAKDEFKTKYEQGDAYNMVAYGGAKLEWYKQADAFKTVVAGKTLDEVKALIAEGNKGNADVQAAGCTIMIHEFVNAIEKAYNNASDSTVTADATLKIGFATEQTATDATDEKAGSNQIETTVFAAAVDANGKIMAAKTDCVQVKFTFDSKGASTFDTTKAIETKRELGDKYGMKAYGGAKYEWYEHADIFESLCVGKTAADVTAFLAEGDKGTADVQAAGCTVYVDGFTKAAAKIK